jgi:hypothetical protein
MPFVHLLSRIINPVYFYCCVATAAGLWTTTACLRLVVVAAATIVNAKRSRTATRSAAAAAWNAAHVPHNEPTSTPVSSGVRVRALGRGCLVPIGEPLVCGMQRNAIQRAVARL